MILATKDPKQFRNKRVRIRQLGKHLDIKILEPKMSFQEMMTYRKQGDQEQIRKGLDGEGITLQV